jgi:hypothetical protein
MKEPRRQPIPDVPAPGIHFELDRLVELVKQGKTEDPFSETRGRTQDALWMSEAFPEWSGLESQDAALWVASTFYKTGHKVRFAVGFDNADVPHMSHIWAEVWNPDLEWWVAFDPNAEAFVDHEWRSTQFLEV